MMIRQSTLLVLWFPGISRYDFAIDAGAGVFTLQQLGDLDICFFCFYYD
jgi:hypothetical protein